MSLKHVAVSVFVLAAVVIPGVSVAQLAPWWCSPQFSSWWGNTSCDQNYGGAGLVVYVTVPNQHDTYLAYGVVRAPSDFSVAVDGNGPTPATFAGSQTGVPVLLGSGPYRVAATGNLFNYSPSYSQGCSGVLNPGQNALCVITMSPSSNYSSYPTPYPYPYTNPQLSCAPSYQTVAAGQTARFEAANGSGPYAWTTAERTYLNVGPVLSVSLQHTGAQSVTVQSGTQTATCTINVVANAGAIIYPSTTPNVPLTTYTYPSAYTSAYAGSAPYVSIVPSLPNAGLEPLSAESVAFAVVGLIGSALIIAPYARKTLVVAGL